MQQEAIYKDVLRQNIMTRRYQDESGVVAELLQLVKLPAITTEAIKNRAYSLVTELRQRRKNSSGLDSFLAKYDLSSSEGIALMCLAESLLRIPDQATIDKLINDKIVGANWQQHIEPKNSLLVNAVTWGLLLTGKIIGATEPSAGKIQTALNTMLKRGSEPIVRRAISSGMSIFSRQFVMAENITEALKRAKVKEQQGYTYSYDMLGEAARTQQDADAYYQHYMQAITKIGQAAGEAGPYLEPGISIKLSALHPRYEWVKYERMQQELYPKLLQLVLICKEYNIGCTIDAEEVSRLDISLDLLDRLMREPGLGSWVGLGLAIQAYQKSGLAVTKWAVAKAKEYKRPLMIRLVKGAYWDSEIKLAQELGYPSYPVFTRKIATDVSYIACVRELLETGPEIYPQFATHNAYTVALVQELSKNTNKNYEFQCLHGMGDILYDTMVAKDKVACRIYAPVGAHKELLPYLVRRLLENGANTSFVNRIVDAEVPIEGLIQDPEKQLAALEDKPHPKIPLPAHIFGKFRANSKGIDVSHPLTIKPLLLAVEEEVKKLHIGGVLAANLPRKDVFTPSNNKEKIGEIVLADTAFANQAVGIAATNVLTWASKTADMRAVCLDKLGLLFEQHKVELIALIVAEGGRTIVDAIAELREAIDFCYYYAACARRDFKNITLPGPTGETNSIQLFGRGIFLCISPWNFPLAIFTGQVVAALVAGNAVIAKPASQTVLIASKAVELMYQAGIPKEVLQLLPGGGSTIGQMLIEDTRISGVMLTGSTKTAKHINLTLAKREGPIVPFIAETGGQNVMLVDSSALLEQVTVDIMTSAFSSAGQRCSALRVLFVQQEISDDLLKMLKGAVVELKVGNPMSLATDIGPVIDKAALATLRAHVVKMEQAAKLIARAELDASTKDGNFIAPTIYEIANLDILEEEVFGPILHVIRFDMQKLDTVLQQINNIGYGLTFGLHSRIESTVEYILSKMRVGNLYVNRNMIGAMVGVQPFGGEGLSGTGPKAGGPRYLQRLATERTRCINTAAVGGNASLMMLGY